jgi:hypothetical protein
MAPFSLFPRVAVLYTGWIYTLARNTQIPLVTAFYFALMFAFTFRVSLARFKGVFLREKHAASDFENTKHRRLRCTERKERGNTNLL